MIETILAREIPNVVKTPVCQSVSKTVYFDNIRDEHGIVAFPWPEMQPRQ